VNYKYLTLEDRHEIERRYGAGDRPADIARSLEIHPATIYREIAKGDTGKLDKYQRPEYSAELAQRRVQENLRRRGKRNTDTELAAADNGTLPTK
jgi:IS30 family transposase